MPLKTIWLLFFLIGWTQQTPQPEKAALTSPLAGSPLRGAVIIAGTAAGDGFLSADLSFQHMDGGDTWFPLQSLNQPVANGVLAAWDTTTITDGNYRLRLIVYDQSAQPETITVENLRVRNYSAIETDTPIPGGLAAILTPQPVTPIPTALPSATPLRTPTALPENPLVVDRQELQSSAVRGGLAVVFLFVFATLLRVTRGRNSRER